MGAEKTTASIFVDAPQTIAGRRWCHLFSEDRAALHAFAARIGLKRCWFHSGRKGSWPHYDVTPAQRIAALKAGAVQADRRTTIELANRLGATRKASAA